MEFQITSSMRYARTVLILAALLCLLLVTGAAAQTADSYTLDGIRNNFALAKANRAHAGGRSAA